MKWFLFLLVSGVALGKTTSLEKQVVDSYESCHHWGGEEPYDAARAKEIADGSKRDCTEAMKVVERAMAAKERTPKTAAYMLQILAISESKPSQRDKWKLKSAELCKTAEPYLRKLDPANEPDAQSAFLSMCPELAKLIWTK